MKSFFVCGLIFLTALTALGADKSHDPAFQLRLVSPGPSDQTERMILVNKDKFNEVLYVEKKILLDQSAVKSAKAVNGKARKQASVSIVFTGAGRKQFADVTRENVGRRLAIVIGGQLLTAPVIRAEVPGGKAEITGNFDYKEARELAQKITTALKKQ
jgi:preprotein translocase subunit SecD